MLLHQITLQKIKFLELGSFVAIDARGVSILCLDMRFDQISLHYIAAKIFRYWL